MSSYGDRGMGIRKNAIIQGNFGKKTDTNQEIYATIGSNFTNLTTGPVPNLHTEPVQLFITYCEFQRGKPRNAQVTKRIWLQNQLKILRAHDPHLLILPYDPTSKANGINHPGHVPQTMDQLSLYFPRMYMQSGHVTAKCRLQSSIPIAQLKWKNMPQLEECNYFIRPTQLKALRTGKAGWLLGAHPDLTFRDCFQEIIPDLLKTRYRKDIEFTITPEKEVIIVGSKRVEQRVLVVRCALDEVENVRVFFTEIFTDQSSLDVGYLARYTFITSHPVGSCTKLHLQKILEAQKTFHKSVHYFIMYGIHNLDTFYPTLVTTDTMDESTTEKDQPSKLDQKNDADTSNLTHQQQDSNMEIDEVSVISQQQEDDVETQQCENEADQPTSPPDVQVQEKESPAQKSQPMSLRMRMYLCLSNQHHDNLFHAVYSTTEVGKIYVLCTQNNRDEALTQLHHLDDAAKGYFSDEIIAKIFVGHKGMEPYVKDYPKLSSHYENYASTLVNMIGSEENPQGGSERANSKGFNQAYATDTTNSSSHSSKNVQSYSTVTQTPSLPLGHQSPSKRYRDGEFIALTKQSRLPQGFDSNIQANNKLNATVSENIARMRNLEQSSKDQDRKIDGIYQTVENYGQDIQSMGNDISSMGKVLTSHSSSIKTLLEGQSAQQTTIAKIDSTLSKTQTNVNEIIEFNKKYLLPAFAKAPHGEGENQS